jgi:N-methylhydantoinase B
MTHALDPITVEVLGNAFAALVEEMGMALIKASYSTNIKERRDCSTALFDAHGQTLAQAEHIPIHLGSLLGIVNAVRERYPLAAIHPGDMFVGNDAYTGGGTHLPDIVVVAPVFFAERLIGFVANLAHHADFLDRGHAHIFQEGLRIPPVKIMACGELCQEVLDLILLNCQVPHERRGDFRAQFAANRLGAQRLQGLCARYGGETVVAAGEALMDYAERMTRTAMAQIPDGHYHFHDTFDHPSLTTPLPLQVHITVQGDTMHLDFSGNPPQGRHGLNMVWSALLATVYYAVKTVLDPTILPNAGFYRALTVTAPEGSIVHCLPPAAVAYRTQTCQRVVDVVHGALAQAVPERLTAAHNGANTAVYFVGTDPHTRRPYTYLETLGGGFGARPTKDGLDGVQVHLTNTSNLPVEALEHEYPLLIERYELVTDSGGPGQWRGGMGLHRQITVMASTTDYAYSGTRLCVPPWGLAGGLPGGQGKLVVHRHTADAAERQSLLRPGESLSVITPGAGGYGDPRQRPRELVRRDLREGKISPHMAKEVYGLDEVEQSNQSLSLCGGKLCHDLLRQSGDTERG